MAHRSAMKQFDFQQPRFRRLIVRMKSPIMDIGVEEKPPPAGAAPASERIHQSHGPEQRPGKAVSEYKNRLTRLMKLRTRTPE